jgi:hypothetical protein
MSSLDEALQRALAVRLNLQISLSQLPIVEEWMDIHLDRWLEHNPTPPDMPDGEGVSYLAMLGSDLRRMWWGAWGDPRGFVPKLADYFKLCNIAKTDAALLDQVGEALEPALVGSWIGVWGGKVATGWHFLDPHPWPKVEAMFGTHEAKYKLKRFVEDHHIERIERFTQSIGDAPFSEVELALPTPSIDTLAAAFDHFTGAPLAPKVLAHLQALPSLPQLAIAVRIRSGAIARLGALLPGIALPDVDALCSAAGIELDAKLAKLAGALGGAVARVDYGRTGDRTGIDVYLEPTEPADKHAAIASARQAN